MTHDDAGPEHDDQLVDFGPPLQQYLAGNPHALADLPPRERELAEQLAPILESARHSPDPAPTPASSPRREQAVRPQKQDPIAIALGLVAGPDDVLDAAQFKSARLRSGLNIKDVAQRLTQRGWNITVSRVLHWQHGNTELAPALIQAIAETLAASPANLRVRPRAVQPSSASALLEDEVIAAFLTDWARQAGVSTDDIRSRARRTLASLNYRNEAEANRADVLAVLRALRRLDSNKPTESR